MTPLQNDFAARCAQASDINEHLPALSKMAAECIHITEFGVRTGHSTVALLHGISLNIPHPGLLVSLESYDIAPARFTPPQLPVHVGWSFRQADTAALPDIAETDTLFIDTLHTCEQVRAELRHAHRVRRWLVLHDTILFGSKGEGGQPGITQAIYEFLAENSDRWAVRSHAPNNNGLLVLERIQ